MKKEEYCHNLAVNHMHKDEDYSTLFSIYYMATYQINKWMWNSK